VDKFKNKYRIKSHRRPNWNYSVDALYFLTICTQNRECNLGSIIDKEMHLSEFGKIVETEWHKSFEIRNELFLHEFILMPNHLHTIVEISSVDPNGRLDLPNGHFRPSPNGNFDPLSNGHFDPTPNGYVKIKPNIKLKSHQPIRLPKSISSFVAGFKSAVNTKIDDYIDEYNLPIPKYNRKNHFFQPNYHDRIIRNIFEYHRIKKYIINNPANW
jgi:putative transposase